MVNSLTLLLIVLAWFSIGYFVYSKFLEKTLVKPNNKNKTPAYRKGIDYQPSKKEFLNLIMRFDENKSTPHPDSQAHCSLLEKLSLESLFCHFSESSSSLDYATSLVNLLGIEVRCRC